MDETIFEEWKRYLDPDILRPTLLLTILYITAFEILKNVIIEKIRDFFTHGFDENGWIVSERYEQDVVRLNRSLTYASLQWLLNNNAINKEDIDLFTKIKSLRNILVHELTKILSEGIPDDLGEQFNDLIYLLNKIDKWWIINVEIPTSDDFENIDDIDEEGIVPGSIMNLKLLIDISIGSDNVAYSYLDEFNNLSKTSNTS